MRTEASVGATRSSRVSICFKEPYFPIIPSDRCLSESVVMVLGWMALISLTNASKSSCNELSVTMGRLQATTWRRLPSSLKMGVPTT